jgi:amino acid adenylation domain-containing protein
MPIGELDARWNATAATFPGDQCLHELIALAAHKAPESTAIVHSHGQITYSELLERAYRVAHYLRSLGVGPEDLVAVCAERSPSMVIGVIGVLFAGGAYVPLDPDYPPDRLNDIVADAEPSVILAQPQLMHVATQLDHDGLNPVCLDPSLPVLESQPTSQPASLAHPDNLACVLYTSGSTGRPKGVGIPHSGLVNQLTWMQREYHINAADSALQKTPFSFDVSAWELFLPLISGAHMVIAESGGHRDPEYLASTIENHHITMLSFVPTMLTEFVKTCGTYDVSSVNHVFTAGETFTPELLAAADRVFPSRIHNLYGPAETSIAVTAHHCTGGVANSRVPIGKPISNTQIHVLTPDGALAKVGVIGEVFVGGVGLARGYHNEAGATAERFVPNPFGTGRLYRTGDLARWLPDGVLQHHGRADTQVKLAGNRVELTEIEHCLTSVPDVLQAAVTTTMGRNDVPGLAAYVVLRPDSALSVHDIRTRLSASCPIT